MTTFSTTTLLFTQQLPLSSQHQRLSHNSTATTPRVNPWRRIGIPSKKRLRCPLPLNSDNVPSRGNNNTKMLGPFFPNLGDSNLLKSEVVRQEMMSLESDYMQLATLGSQYQKFDREGKLMYVEKALDVVDRFNIFLTRLKLAEDFSSAMFIKQYQTKLAEYGLTIESLFENTKKSLHMMKDEIPNA